MACHHHFFSSNIAEYDICRSCGTYFSRTAMPPDVLYDKDYWGATRSLMAEQAWNVDMHMENGVSKNRFVLDRIESSRGSALDIGCAPGRLLFWLKWAARFGNVIGIDPGNTAEIRRIGAFDGLIYQGFFPSFTRELPGNQFDYISGMDVFEHSFDPEDFLIECKRLLRTKGQLFLMMPMSDRLAADSRFFNAVEHVYLHSESNLNEMMKDAGFVSIRFDRWTIGHETVSARKP